MGHYFSGTAQYAMERKVLHITLHDKGNNSAIRSKTKVYLYLPVPLIVLSTIIIGHTSHN